MFFASLLMLIIQTVFKFFIFLLVLRFWMVTFRLPFRHPIGEFVRACTSWMTRPFEAHSSSHTWFAAVPLGLAWILSFLMIQIVMFLFGHSVLMMSMTITSAFVILGVSICEVVIALLWILTIATIFQAILSWIHPYAPIMPFLNALTAPIINPVRRRLPLVGNIDLSPLIVLLVLQIAIQALRMWYPFYLIGLRM